MTANECSETELLIEKEAHGWTEAERLRVEAHLGGCRDCREALAIARFVRDTALAVPTLSDTARQLLTECGSLIRQMVAGLSMPDWPEGVRRAINFSLGYPDLAPAMSGPATDTLLDSLREADGYEVEGD